MQKELRIIKFRSWDGFNEKMSYWTLTDLCTWDTKNEKPSALEDWMQFTSLLDKKGTEIYEGDIIEYDKDFVNKPFEGNRSVIIFKLGSFLIAEKINDTGGFNGIYLHALGFKVIGNIYKNKELLR